MILCAGESLIDMVPGEGGFRPLPGGAVYNTAVALGRLGVRTGYLWPISTDPFGQALIGPLAQAGVDISLCPRTDRLTTLAFVTLTGTEARYSFYDEGSAGRMFSAAELPDLPQEVQALFIGGISLVPDPCGATIEVLAERARARGIPVMLDPNIRPFFIKDAAAYRARLDRLIALADFVKLSGDDLDWLAPGQDHAEVISGILAAGPSVVFRTNGAEGATAHHVGGTQSVPAQRVTVADTIGAGDTFNAGVLAALAAAGALTAHPQGQAPRDEVLAEALAHGIRTAAITVSRAGANPPWAHELDQA